MNDVAEGSSSAPLPRGTTSYGAWSPGHAPQGTSDPDLNIRNWYLGTTLPLYGLQPAWQGHRGTGSVSLTHNPDGRYQADRLTLTHQKTDGVDLAVTTHRGAASQRFIEAMVINDLAKIAVASPTEVGRIAAHRQSVAETKAYLRAQPDWREQQIIVDGAPVIFRIVGAGSKWAAYTHHGDIFLQLTANGFPPEQVILVTITDLDPYLG